MTGPFFKDDGFDLSIGTDDEGNLRILLDGFDVTSALMGIDIELHTNELARATFTGILSNVSTTNDGLKALERAKDDGRAVNVSVHRTFDPDPTEFYGNWRDI